MKYTCRVKYRAPYSANDLEVEEKMISIYMYMTQCLSPHLNSAAIEDLNRSAAHWERLLSDKPPFLLLLARQLSICICISKCAFTLQLAPILAIEVFLSTRPPEFFSQPPITRPEQEPSLSTWHFLSCHTTIHDTEQKNKQLHIPDTEETTRVR